MTSDAHDEVEAGGERPARADRPRPSTRRTYLLLSALYLGQWVAPSFLAGPGLAGILRERGASLATLAVLHSLVLVGLAKVLWAPVVDRFGSRRRGHYRSWLLAAQSAMCVAVSSLALVDPVDDLPWVLAVVAVLWLLAGTQDVATDAVSVIVVDPADRGPVQGLQVAAGFVGTIVGGGAALVIYDLVGWHGSVLALAVATALPIVALLGFREPPRSAPGDRATWREAMRLFARPEVARWGLLVLPLLWSATGGAFALLTPMLIDAGWSLSRVATVVTLLGGLAAVTSALAAGRSMTWLGRRRGLLWFSTAQVAAVVLLLPLTSGAAPSIVSAVVVCVLHVSYAAATTAASTISMDMCRELHAGSDMTVLSTVANVVSFSVGAGVVGLAGAWGYPVVIAALAALSTLGPVAAAMTMSSLRPARLPVVPRSTEIADL